MIELEKLLSRPSSWLTVAKDSDIVVTSRVRLARNLANFSFPAWGGEDNSVEVWKYVKPVLTELPSVPECLSMEMSEVGHLDKQVLFERHLISREISGKGVGSGLVMATDEQLGIMVNEEDHLRLQAICSGLGLKELWAAWTRLTRRSKLNSITLTTIGLSDCMSE